MPKHAFRLSCEQAAEGREVTEADLDGIRNIYRRLEWSTSAVGAHQALFGMGQSLTRIAELVPHQATFALCDRD